MGQPVAPKKSQSQKFIETARELGCDEDEAAFEEKLKAIARQKPKVPDRRSKRNDKDEEAPE